MKWTLLITAPDQLTAEMWKELLVNNGIQATIRPQDISSFLGVSSQPCGIMVDDRRVEEARDVLRGEEVT